MGWCFFPPSILNSTVIQEGIKEWNKRYVAITKKKVKKGCGCLGRPIVEKIPIELRVKISKLRKLFYNWGIIFSRKLFKLEYAGQIRTLCTSQSPLNWPTAWPLQSGKMEAMVKLLSLNRKRVCSCWNKTWCFPRTSEGEVKASQSLLWLLAGMGSSRGSGWSWE